MMDENAKKPDKRAKKKERAAQKRSNDKCDMGLDPISTECVSDDEEYWEEMLFLSRGPRKWNIGCGCG